jgi:hypothetical protein
MSDRLEDDLMDDLMAEPEGRSHAMDDFDEAEGADEFDELDEAEDLADDESGMDELEEAVAEALDSEDFDEFWGKIGGFLKKAARGVGSVARVVAPIANMIPIPQAQMIGKVAGVLGDVLADEGDEMDALEDLADLGDEDEAAVHVAAPVIAGLAIRQGLKHHAARIAPAQKRQLVHAVTAATRQISRAHGPHAVVAIPGIVRHARTFAVRRGMPASALPGLVKRVTAKAVRSPVALRKLHRTAVQLRGSGSGVRRRGMRWGGSYAPGQAGGIARSGRYRHGGMQWGGYEPGGAPAAVGHRGRGLYRSSGAPRSSTMAQGGGMPGAVCPGCGRRRSWRMEGPIRLTIDSV